MTTKRAVLYARVSSDDTKKDGRNLAGQLEMCRQHAQSRGWRIIAELSEDDRGASGADLDLPQLNKAIEMAHAGAYDVLVVREIDRLARDLVKQLIVGKILLKAGVKIEYVIGDYPDTPEGNLMKYVVAIIAEYEREIINVRMTRGRHQRVKAGGVLVSERPPYGYDVVKGENGVQKLVVNEEQATIVRLIFHWYVQGDGPTGPMSLRQIARRLTEMHVPTYCDIHPECSINKRRVLHGVWSITSVHCILKSETYTGTWRYGKTTMAGGTPRRKVEKSPLSAAVPALIDVETWQIAIAKLAQNKQDAKRNRKYNYLLSGRVTCGACGGKMHGSSSPKKKDKPFTCYMCNARRFPEKYAHVCNAPRFQVKYVDPIVWDWVRSLLIDSEALSVGLDAQAKARERESLPLSDELDKIEQLITEHRSQQERLLDIYLDGSLAKKAWAERNKRTETALKDLEHRREELLSRINADAVTSNQIQDIQKFAVEIGRSIEGVDSDFAMQRRIIEMLDVQATLSEDADGIRLAQISCVLGEGEFALCLSGRVSADHSLGRDG